MSQWKSTILAVAAAVLLAPCNAVLAHAKSKHTYTRKQGAGPAAALSERARPSAAAPAPGGAPKEARPEIDGDVAMSLEAIRSSFREEQEQILVELIERTPDRNADEKANYYFMLGELYAKQHRFYRLQSQELAIGKGTGKGTGTGTGTAKSTAKEMAEKSYRKLVQAVMTYKALADNAAFRNYPKLDQALFYYGYMLRSAAKHDEARAVFDRLLKDHPRSKFVPEAHLVFADFFFERSDLGNALDRYRMVLKFPGTQAYWYAMYRTGWIAHQQRRFQESLETFYRVAQATKADPKQDILHRAAKKDYVRAYAEVGRVELAYNAFARVDGASALEMLEVLGDHYLEQGKSGKAIVAFQDLMKRAPRHKHVCLWQYSVAQAMLSLPGATNADRVTEIENLVRVHAAVAGAKTLPAVEAAECRDNAAAMAGDHARVFHAEFAKTQDPETLAHADRLYRLYLDAFPGAPDHAQTQYFHAELLWSRAMAEKQPRLATELWERASAAFTRVVEAGKVEPAIRKEAAYAAVLGWKNALDVDPRPKVQAGPIEVDDEKAYQTIPAPKEIPERERKMIAAFDLYIRHVRDPDDEELIRIKFLKANVYRRYDQYDRAIPLFEDVLAKHRTHEAAEVAAQLLLDAYNRMHRHDEMIAAAARLQADQEFVKDKPELRKVIAKLQYQATEKRAEATAAAAKASGDFAKWVACGQAYMAIYNSDPERAENDRVLHNAMVCFHQGKSIGLAIRAFELLEQYYAGSPHLPRALALVGKAYGDTAFYDKAAAVLERYARKYAGEADAPKVMSEVVFYNKGLGEDAKAIANTKFFVETFGAKQPAEAANAMFSLASVYERRGDGDGLVRHLRAYLARFGETGGAERRVIAHAKIGLALWAASCPVKLVDGACVKVVRERAVGRREARLAADQKQCGDATRTKVTAVARDARKVKEAMAALAAAAAEWERVGGEDAGAARHYLGQSKLAEADRAYEAFLGIGMPSNLDFHKADPAIQAKSLKRFDAWLMERKRAAEAAIQKYDAARKVADNATSIAAVARLAQIQHNQADALFTTEIPLAVRTGRFAEDKVEAFCDRMDEYGTPLEEEAIRAYKVCLDQSKRIGWYSEWSRLCERELGQLRPVEHPPASELRAEPTRTAAIVVVEPAIRRLD